MKGHTRGSICARHIGKRIFLWPYCCPYGNARTHRSVCSIHAHGKDVGNFILLERIFGFIEYQYIGKMPEFAQYDESKSILYRHGTMSKRIPLEFSWDFYSRRLAELVLLDIAIVQRKCFPKKRICVHILKAWIYGTRRRNCAGGFERIWDDCYEYEKRWRLKWLWKFNEFYYSLENDYLFVYWDIRTLIRS